MKYFIIIIFFITALKQKSEIKLEKVYYTFGDSVNIKIINLYNNTYSNLFFDIDDSIKNFNFYLVLSKLKSDKNYVYIHKTKKQSCKSGIKNSNIYFKLNTSSEIPIITEFDVLFNNEYGDIKLSNNSVIRFNDAIKIYFDDKGNLIR